MRRSFLFFFFVVAFLSLPAIAKRFTYGFRVAKIELCFPHHPEWDIPLDPKIHPILEQPFHFIGKGAQCYVFESRDKEHVVKLFRYDRTLSEEKVLLLFNACKMAYDSLREETGLIYIHLNVEPMGLPVLLCRDAVGRRYQLPLDQYRFALQKKAAPFQETLKKAKKDSTQMEKRIDQFVDLLRARAGKRIFNSDPSLNRNFGFLEGRAIEFDFGNYRSVPSLDQAGEVKRYTSSLRRWLQKEAPEWVAYLDERIQAPQ